MYGCNAINGVPSTANPKIAAALHAWNFTGYRTTDGGGIGGVSGLFKYVPTVEQAIAVSMREGESDIDDGNTYATHLLDALEAGALNMSSVRRALFNTMRMRFRLGLFDPNSTEGRLPEWRRLGVKDVDTEAVSDLPCNVRREGG